MPRGACLATRWRSRARVNTVAQASRAPSAPPHQHFGLLIASCERADRKLSRRVTSMHLFGSPRPLAAPKRSAPKSSTSCMPPSSTASRRGTTATGVRRRSKCASRFFAPLARTGRSHYKTRPPCAPDEGSLARLRARPAGPARRARRQLRPLDLPAHPLGARRPDATRAVQRSRGDGVLDPRRDEGDGTATIREAHSGPRESQDRLRAPHFEGPHTRAQARAARRGGEPRCRARPCGLGRRGSEARARRSERKPSAPYSIFTPAACTTFAYFSKLARFAAL